MVWLHDKIRRQTLYFAHLQEYHVIKNQLINRGDTIGTVGNTGNAKTTPPHLHFGIYKNGPVNPYHFIASEYEKQEYDPDTVFLGRDFLPTTQLFLKSKMANDAPDRDTLEHSDNLKVVGVNHHFIRVRIDDGTLGYLNKKELVNLQEAPLVN